MLFTEIRADINSEIASKEALIAQLQAEVAGHLNHIQEVQSSEVAAETAIQQLQMAIDMLKQIGCPDGLKALEKAVKEQFKGTKEPRKKAALLTAAPKEEKEEVLDTEPDVSSASEPIETTATAVDEDENEDEELTKNTTVNVSTLDVSVEDLNGTEAAPIANGSYPHRDLFPDDAWTSTAIETEAVRAW